MKPDHLSRTIKPRTSQPLPESEWNFNGIPHAEIEACYFYEYSREYFKKSQTLNDLRSRWEAYHCWRKSRKRKKALPTPKIHGMGLLANEHATRILAARQGFATPFDFRTFPALAWQELRARPRPEAWPVRAGNWQAEDREQRRKYKADRFHIETLAQLEPANIRTLPAWIEYHQFFRRGQNLLNTEYGFFAVNWDYSIPEIRRAFVEWLIARQAEKNNEPKIVSNSRGQFKDKLRWLGALRVKNHYRKCELVDFGDSNLKEDAPYAHFPDLVKAASKAKRLIAQMFPSDDEAEQIVAAPIEGEPGLPSEEIDRLKRVLGVGEKS